MSAVPKTFGYFPQTRKPDEYVWSIPDNSCAPRFKAQELVLIDSKQTPEPGDDVFVRVWDGRHLIRELVAIDAKNVEVRALASGDCETLARREILFMHVITDRVSKRSVLALEARSWRIKTDAFVPKIPRNAYAKVDTQQEPKDGDIVVLADDNPIRIGLAWFQPGIKPLAVVKAWCIQVDDMVGGADGHP